MRNLADSQLKVKKFLSEVVNKEYLSLAFATAERKKSVKEMVFYPAEQLVVGVLGRKQQLLLIKQKEKN